ncbi:MAG: YesL family protein, partial [Eubacterium sp.]|nr:YesL family protein [Eubacterium sp.]
MKFAFNIESKLWKFFDYAGDLVILNLLFVLTSLPVVTIGASITAMDAVLFKMKEKRTDDVRREYFREWKANFKNSTIIWLFLLSFVIFCAMNFQMAAQAEPEHSAGHGNVLPSTATYAQLDHMLATSPEAKGV